MLEWLDATFWNGFCMRDGTCGAGAWLHTWARQPLHIALSAGATLLALTLQMELAARGITPRLRGFYFFIAPCAVLLIGLWVREPFDGAAGDDPLKSVIDVLVGWLGGIVLSCVGLWRLAPRLHHARTTAEHQWATMKARRVKGIR